MHIKDSQYNVVLEENLLPSALTMFPNSEECSAQSRPFVSSIKPCSTPQNQSVVVADFGLARWVNKIEVQSRQSPKEKAGQQTPPDRRRKYTVVGNPYWMAPEMIHGMFKSEMKIHVLVL